MLETADNVAKRYNVSREYQDEYSLRSQQRIAAAQENGLFKDEIVPMKTKMKENRQGDEGGKHRQRGGRSRRLQSPGHDA